MTTTLGSLAVQLDLPAGAAVLIDQPSAADPTKRTFGKVVPGAIAVTIPAAALLDAVTALLLNLSDTEPTQPGTPWLDAGALRITPAAPAAPPPSAAPLLLGPTDNAPLTGPADGAPLLSPTGA